MNTKEDDSLKKRAGLTRTQKKEIALDLYLHTHYTQKEICEIVGWTQPTFTSNKQKFQWDTLRDATTKTPEIVLTNLYKLLEKLTKESLEGDYYAKDIAMIAGAIEKQEKRITNLSTYIQACKIFVEWLQPTNLELAQTITKLYRQFIQDLIDTD
ncbi:hypothetical protein [uncultured Microscilla sp.]|uniref:hypothetical protein n=1 Tax=uncultured Microscilla sp. TaxID=432653 RepID=UPI00263356E1|nr:hypothetical protein [uncultured Microscilla sp.]